MQLFKRASAILTQRCPVCLTGPVFHSLWGMNKDCPHCGVHFERETGYFLNAMFFAYVMGFVVLIPWAVYLYFLHVSTAVFTVAIVAELAIVWPAIFRYSRVLWMHLDQLLDPRQAQPRQ